MPPPPSSSADRRLPGDWEIKLSGGEPFRHPDFLDAVGKLSAARLRVSVVTNFAAPLDELHGFADATRTKLGYPAGQTYTGNCGNGHRIFVNREASKAQVLVQNGSFWTVVDCNATSDHQAVLQSSQVGAYDIYMRILGKPGGRFQACGQTVTDFATGDTLCLLGTIDLTRSSGHSKFQLAPSTMFDASVEDLIWTVDTNTNFRIVQFRVYSRP